MGRYTLSWCYVFGCKSRADPKNYDTTFHRFPKDRALRKLWVAATGREAVNFINARICSKHFEEKCFKRTKKFTFLLSGSVPTLFVQCTPLAPAAPLQRAAPCPRGAALLCVPIKVTSGPSLKCQVKETLGSDFNPVITDIRSEADLIKQEDEDPQNDDTLSLAENADQLSDADQPSEDLIPLSYAQVPLSNAPDPLSDVKVEKVEVGVDEVEVTRPVEETRPVELTKPVELSKAVELTSAVKDTRPVEATSLVEEIRPEEATRPVGETGAVEESTVPLPPDLRQQLSWAGNDCYNLIRKQANQINNLSVRYGKQRQKLHNYVQILRRRDKKIGNMRAEVEALKSFIGECGWEVSSCGGGKIDVRRIQIRSSNTVVGQNKPNRQLLIVKRDYKPPKSSVSAQHTSDAQMIMVGVKSTSDILQKSLLNTLNTSENPQKSLVGVKRTLDTQDTSGVLHKASVGVNRTLDIQEKMSVNIPDTSDVLQKSSVSVNRTLDIQEKSSVTIPDTSNVLQKSTVGVKRISDMLQRSSSGISDTSDVFQKSKVRVKRTSDMLQRSSSGILDTSDVLQNSTVDVKRPLNIQENSSVIIPDTSDVLQKSLVAVKRTLDIRQKSSSGISGTSDVRQKSSVGVKRILNNPSIIPQTSDDFQRTSDVRQNELVIQIDGMHNTVLRAKLVRLDDNINNSMETG